MSKYEALMIGRSVPTIGGGVLLLTKISDQVKMTTQNPIVSIKSGFVGGMHHSDPWIRESDVPNATIAYYGMQINKVGGKSYMSDIMFQNHKLSG
jgi:hypothetical protein